MDMLELAIQAAREGGRLARFHAGRLDAVGHKRDRADLVTAVDREIEARLRALLLGACPDHAFFGEEHGASGRGRHRWLVDPIDGTLNFVSGFPYFCTSVGLEVDGRIEVAALYDPSRDELFTARRGQGAWCNGAPLRVTATAELADAMIATGYNYDPDEGKVQATLLRVARVVARARAVRRAGAAALDLAYVAAGRFDGFWEAGLNPWDVAAAWLLVEEAGGAAERARRRALHPGLRRRRGQQRSAAHLAARGAGRLSDRQKLGGRGPGSYPGARRRHLAPGRAARRPHDPHRPDDAGR